jgi:uncharacterized protein YbaR (Trm112 family)
MPRFVCPECRTDLVETGAERFACASCGRVFDRRGGVWRFLSETRGARLESARVRTGFIQSVLAFTLQKQLAQNVTAKARVALWMLAGRAAADDGVATRARAVLEQRCIEQSRTL